MPPLHKVRNAITVANYYVYNQTLLKIGTANGVASSAYLTTSYVSVITKCINMNRNPVQPKTCGMV
jgi:hypothetical protein